MKKRILALVLCLGIALSLFGCAGDIAQMSTVPATPPTEAAVAAAAFPVTVTDAAGREVTITQAPEKLVSGYYITTSMLIALGLQDKLVGVEAKADSRPIYSLAAPEILELPSVGTAKEFDLEGCAALSPDLVVLPIKLQDTVPALEALGIPVLLANPESLEQLKETVRMLGTATGANDRAAALLDYYDQSAQELASLLEGAEAPSVYLAGNSSYLSTAGGKMYQDTLIQLGGGRNVAGTLEDLYWVEVSYEQILAWDPQVILIAAEADYSREDILNDPQLASLTAVQNGAVFAMPSAVEAWDSPIPGAMMGSRWIAAMLHEDIYSFEAFCADAAAFYKEFYGFQLDTSLLNG